jgi:peptidyl-prolyl cis-trans isomerase A (cyclophilin A)
MKPTLVLIIISLWLTPIPNGFGQSPPDSGILLIKTELGDIQVILLTKQAPVTCANFLKYIRLAGVKGGEFYRTVTPDNQTDKELKIAVIQGGFDISGLDTSLLDPIPLERTNATGLIHGDGTLSMARDKPDSGSTEFFICIGRQPFLDYDGMRNPDGQGFAAFGRVISGMDIVKKIQMQPADGQTLTPPVRFSVSVLHGSSETIPPSAR